MVVARAGELILGQLSPREWGDNWLRANVVEVFRRAYFTLSDGKHRFSFLGLLIYRGEEFMLGRLRKTEVGVEVDFL